MARAMSGWWPWNPNAIRVSNRILVLVDSIKPCDRRCSRVASMAARWAVILRCRSMNAGSRDRRARASHRRRACLPSSPLTAKT